MTTSADSPGTTPEDRIREALREVVDPEVGINIVDLGLIYGITVTGQGVQVVMTMTSAACPMGELIVEEVKEVLSRHAPEAGQDVRLVWDPPWSPAMMSERARRTLE